MSDWEIIEGDCIKAMQAMPEASVDAIVTDPPYGLGFMGKAWDSLPPGHEVGKAFLHVLKPGGHLVAFGGTRTYHRLACALEDAGFEIRDSLMWVYGSGFPKSHNLDGDREGWGTALKPSHEPIVLARKPLVGTVAANVEQHGTGALNVDGCRVECDDHPGVHKSMSNALHEGYQRPWRDGGTPQYKDTPAGRWPPNLLLTHAADCTEEDCGETCPVRELDRQAGGRYGFSECGSETDEATRSSAGESRAAGRSTTSPNTSRSGKTQTGLFPTDLSSTTATASRTTTGSPTSSPCHDLSTPENTATATESEMEAGRSGVVNAGGGSPLLPSIAEAEVAGSTDASLAPIDRSASGNGPSRFFPRFRYVAKASSGERNAGLEGMAEGHPVGGRDKWTEQDRRRGEGVTRTAAANVHPTVKPVALMRWLCRLITPPGGTVLDPFAGSGTTLLAAIQEGFRAIGIEREPEYAAIARRRVEEDAPLFNRGTA